MINDHCFRPISNCQILLKGCLRTKKYPEFSVRFNFKWSPENTVLEADVGGINNVKPPSMHRRFRNIVAGRGARYLQRHILSGSGNFIASISIQNCVLTNYPGMKEDVMTALMRSSLESNWSTNKPLGLQRIWVTATVIIVAVRRNVNCSKWWRLAS